MDPEVHKLTQVPPRTNGQTEIVPMIILDSVKLHVSPCLIKLDVEGMELPVLQGGVNFLKEHQFPPILLEIWGYEWYKINKQDLLEFLLSLGY
ncbi:hypothetical protein B9Z44_09730 [Limnohabitans curvus]|uniref:Methyltransferase FkbM domain-containing protein n=1 Tax=Limnohabitans curvus TaxID=323423 RepID=A0A315EV44_9BURK|nr:hypothetical protein B9Z44_09730 [Limnohabitans curvus]